MLNILQNSFNAISTKKMTTVSNLHSIFYHFKTDDALVQLSGNISMFKPLYRIACFLSNSHITQHLIWLVQPFEVFPLNLRKLEEIHFALAEDEGGSEIPLAHLVRTTQTPIPSLKHQSRTQSKEMLALVTRLLKHTLDHRGWIIRFSWPRHWVLR